ncbi:MAG: lamin tail domain-containing protein, partial [bacterium]|nr:lamin tail domain-containing protein [bacterium]
FAVATVDGTTYYSLADAVEAAGNGGTLTLLVSLEEAGSVPGVNLAATETEGVYTVSYVMSDSSALRISEVMPKAADDDLDPNGFESGWIEFRNTSESAWVDLADYRLIRVNRGKKT